MDSFTISSKVDSGSGGLGNILNEKSNTIKLILSVLTVLFLSAVVFLRKKRKEALICLVAAVLIGLTLAGFILWEKTAGFTKTKNSSTPDNSISGNENSSSLVKQKIYYDSGKLYYDGEVKDGKPNGTGKIYYESGVLSYEGQVKDGKANGKGTYYSADGQKVYEGDVADNQYNGKGIYYFTNGDRYDGDFVNSKRQGNGAYYWADGGVYIGAWKDDQIVEGQGNYTKNNKE